jgi:hypothetical protein
MAGVFRARDTLVGVPSVLEGQGILKRSETAGKVTGLGFVNGRPELFFFDKTQWNRDTGWHRADGGWTRAVRG